MKIKHNLAKYNETYNLRVPWDQSLFYNSLSKYVWKSKLFSTFAKYLEAMLTTAIKQIKKIETYYRP